MKTNFVQGGLVFYVQTNQSYGGKKHEKDKDRSEFDIIA